MTIRDRGPATEQRLMERVTAEEPRERLGPTDVAVLAFGAVEHHGRHLPLGTDGYIGVQTTCRVLGAVPAGT